MAIWPELSGQVWLAVAAVALALIPLTYLPEFRHWWVAKRGGGKPIPGAVLITDAEAFRLNPGVGRIAARLICVQPDLDASDRVFGLFQAAVHKTDDAAPYAALANRLIEAGRTHDAETLLLEIPDHVSDADRESALREFFLPEDETD